MKRKRLSPDERRASILAQAQQLFAQNGYANTDMDDIRRACDISRGGLYHHFASKRAVLEGLATCEAGSLAEVVQNCGEALPFIALLKAGSAHMGAENGLPPGFDTPQARRSYLDCLDHALEAALIAPLAEKLAPHISDGSNPRHVAELFVVINAHINRRALMGDWSENEAAAFAVTALSALAPFLRASHDLAEVIAALREKGRGR